MTKPTRKEGEIGYFTGASRTGKTASAKQHVKDHARAIVWSPKEPIDHWLKVWKGSTPVLTIADLKTFVTQNPTDPAHVVFLPASFDDFTDFCRLAFAWGIMAPCTVVSEELADVSRPGKAPAGWGELLRQGLGYGINIYAMSQRPTESDTTILGNQTFIRTHKMARAADRKMMAAEIDVPLEKVEALKPLDWIQRGPGDKLTTGRLVFK